MVEALPEGRNRFHGAFFVHVRGIRGELHGGRFHRSSGARHPTALVGVNRYRDRHGLGGGFPAVIVDRVIRLTDIAEYKRRQGPLGVKITPKAFGKDRRMPVTNRYRG